MPKPNYALPPGAAKYLNGCDYARKIITHLYRATNPWVKVTTMRDLFGMTHADVVSVARKLSKFELIGVQVVNTTNKSVNGKYWKLSPERRDGIQHYLNRWNIENGVEA